MGGDLKVFSVNPATGALQLRISSPPQFVTGIDKLVQIVALDLLTTPGRSIVSPGRGAGFTEMIGSNIDPNDPGELFADIRLRVNATETYIKKEQVNSGRPSSELLSQLQIIDVIANETNTDINIVIAVINEDQDIRQAAVTIL